ncbi:hypothetical protein PROFUN_10513 [Planoprotostelium fungivorum]|uniref:HTH HARE-type domain-containing protein n=1 Tax=Planoprotostelium fungivorum TaxID=1890364 RepID=A0A2P6NDC0_9EUKA|nr:hypothetical protein PROFUN_10513 [Planoprotostelium fungivorum]
MPLRGRKGKRKAKNLRREEGRPMVRSEESMENYDPYEEDASAPHDQWTIEAASQRNKRTRDPLEDGFRDDSTSRQDDIDLSRQVQNLKRDLDDVWKQLVLERCSRRHLEATIHTMSKRIERLETRAAPPVVAATQPVVFTRSDQNPPKKKQSTGEDDFVFIEDTEEEIGSRRNKTKRTKRPKLRHTSSVDERSPSSQPKADQHPIDLPGQGQASDDHTLIPHPNRSKQHEEEERTEQFLGDQQMHDETTSPSPKDHHQMKDAATRSCCNIARDDSKETFPELGFKLSAYYMLKREGKDLTAKQIVTMAIEEGFLVSTGKTPSHTLVSVLCTENKKKEGSPFLLLGNSTYRLKPGDHPEYDEAIEGLMLD